MSIELQSNEGEVTLREFAPEEPVEESEVTEEAAPEETPEDLGQAADTVEIEGGETDLSTFTEDEVREIMKIHEQKIVEELQKTTQPEAKAEEKAAPKRPTELVTATLEEVLANIGEDDIVTGKDMKDILIKTFSALNTKSEQFVQQDESQRFDQAGNLYAQQYIPAMIQKFGLDPNSRDARFIQSEFIQGLVASTQQFGRTEKAAREAATRHMLAMSKEFEGTAPRIAPAKKPAVIIEKKLASGNTGSEPPVARTTGVDPTLIKRVEQGKASQAELLRIINSRK